MRRNVDKNIRCRGRSGGGASRLLALAFLALVTVGGALVRAASPELPTTQDALVAEVRHAIETGDFSTFEQLVLWTDVGAYKRRVIASQIRHSLARPIRSIQVEEADIETRRELQNLRNLRLNLPVSELLRVTFSDSGSDPVAPATVFLIGKLNGAYRIALLVKKAKREETN